MMRTQPARLDLKEVFARGPGCLRSRTHSVRNRLGHLSRRLAFRSLGEQQAVMSALGLSDLESAAVLGENARRLLS